MRNAVALGTLLMLVSCSSSGGDFQVQTVSAEQACNDYISAQCDVIFKCANTVASVFLVDAATCKRRLVINCTKTFEAEGTSMTPAKLEQCALDVAKVSCTDILSNNVPASCKPEAGKLENGRACGDDSQCQSTFCSKKDSSCGVCGALPSVGTPCTGGNGFLAEGPCGHGLQCANSVCVKPKLKDETGCDSTTAPCLTGLSCFGGKCVTAAQAGEKCDDKEVAAPKCDGTLAGLYCGGLVAKDCRKIKTATVDAQCGLVSGDLVACAVGGAFNPAGACQGFLGPPTPASLTGKCIAPAADGAACDMSKGPGCLAPASCVSGLCKLPDPICK